MVDVSTIEPHELPSLLLTERRELPLCAAIYFAIAATGQIAYIGRTKCLRTRWKDHDQAGVLSARYQSVRIAWFSMVENEHLMDATEAECIARFKPPLNGKHRTTVPLTARLPSARLNSDQLQRLMRASELTEKPTSELVRRAIDKELAQLAKRFPELAKAA